MFDCAPIAFPFSHLLNSVAPHCSMTGWVCQWKPFWTLVDDSFKKVSVEEWVFQVSGTSEFHLSGGEGDVFPETPNVSLPVPSSPWGPPENEDTACSRNVLSHYCLLCSHDLHVNVWNYPSPVLFCLAARILSQDLITLPCGERWAIKNSRPNTWLTFTKLLPTSVMLLNAFSHLLLSHMVSINTFPLNHISRRAQHLQLEPWAATWKGRCHRETNCGKVAYH